MNSRHVESEIFAMLGKRWGIFEQSRSVTTSVFRALLKLECLSMFCFFFSFSASLLLLALPLPGVDTTKCQDSFHA